MKSKICLISFDNWKYDQYIVDKLIEKGIDAYHISLGSYKHANLKVRVLNAFSKVFLRRNLKKINKQKFILDTLKQKGYHDQILVINPDVIDLECHIEIKKNTKVYNAYLYDCVERFPVEHLLENKIFDTIFSFDENDCLHFGFEKSNNYIYFEKPLPSQITTSKVVTVASFDKRFFLFNEIAYQLTEKKCSFDFVFVSKWIHIKKLKYNFKVFFGLIKGRTAVASLRFYSKKINIKKLHKRYATAEIILDIVQGSQTGLSFRIFEALAFGKKIITNNKTISNYSFYNSANILIIDSENPVIADEFLTQPYIPIPENIYNEYTLETWINKIFKIEVEFEG